MDELSPNQTSQDASESEAVFDKWRKDLRLFHSMWEYYVELMHTICKLPTYLLAPGPFLVYFPFSYATFLYLLSNYMSQLKRPNKRQPIIDPRSGLGYLALPSVRHAGNKKAQTG